MGTGPGGPGPGYNGATFISQSVPTTMTAGATYSVSVTKIMLKKWLSLRLAGLLFQTTLMASAVSARAWRRRREVGTES